MAPYASSDGRFLLGRGGKGGGPCAFLGPWRGSCLRLSGCGLDRAPRRRGLRFAAGTAFEFSFLVFVHDFFDFPLLSRAGHCHRSGYTSSADKKSGTAPFARPRGCQFVGNLERPCPILVDPVSVGAIGPVRLCAHRIVRRPLEARAIEIHTISAEIGTIGQGLPRQRMIALAHT